MILFGATRTHSHTAARDNDLDGAPHRLRSVLLPNSAGSISLQVDGDQEAVLSQVSPKLVLPHRRRRWGVRSGMVSGLSTKAV